MFFVNITMGKKPKNRRLEALEASVDHKAKLVKKSVCSVSFLLSALKTLGCILFYYCFSISLTFYNQRFIHHFKFPLSITLTHLVVKFIMAGIVRLLMTCRTGEQRVTLTWWEYFKRVAPPGVASTLDIGLSNWSFEYITVSLYTMTKSTVIVFILGFSLLFRLEKPRCSLVFVIMFIAAGLFLFTYQSTQFHLKGFLMVLTASFLSGMRWTLAQLVLQKKEIGLTNPVDMMYHIQPWMIIAMLPLSAGFEGLHVATSEHVFGFHDFHTFLGNMALLFSGAILAFFMEFAEFLLLYNTSSITLSISGIFKEICTLYLAAQVNGDQMNMVNGLGLVVCLLGIALHVILKAIREHGSSGEPSDESVEMLLRNGNANIEDDDEEEEIFNVRRDR